MRQICLAVIFLVKLNSCQGSSMVEHHIHNVAVVGSIPTPGTYENNNFSWWRREEDVANTN